jgi:hypothetical protein
MISNAELDRLIAELGTHPLPEEKPIRAPDIASDRIGENG